MFREMSTLPPAVWSPWAFGIPEWGCNWNGVGKLAATDFHRGMGVG